MQILESSRPIRNVNTLSPTHSQAGGGRHTGSEPPRPRSQPARGGTSMHVHVCVRTPCVRVPRVRDFSVGFPFIQYMLFLAHWSNIRYY